MAKRTSNWCRPKKRLAIYLRDGYACTYCRRTAESGAFMTLDHVLAHVLGGANSPDNLVTACRRCNSRKKALSVDEFAIILSDEGINPRRIRKRIRRRTQTDLRPYLAMASLVLKTRQETADE